MYILISDLVNRIKSTFDSTMVLSVDSVYEKINGTKDLRLVISMNKVLYDKVNVVYTKLVFTCDESKTKVIKNNFTYLFDINCEYIRIDFSDVVDFGNKLKDIFKNDKFGDDIKILSKFVKSPSTLINTWFEENDISDISIVNVEIEKIPIRPCDSTVFDFKIELNNNQKVDLSISKKSEKDYNFKFKIFNNIYNKKEVNLNNLVGTIGYYLENKIKM